MLQLVGMVDVQDLTKSVLCGVSILQCYILVKTANVAKQRTFFGSFCYMSAGQGKSRAYISVQLWELQVQAWVPNPPLPTLFYRLGYKPVLAGSLVCRVKCGVQVIVTQTQVSILLCKLARELDLGIRKEVFLKGFSTKFGCSSLVPAQWTSEVIVFPIRSSSVWSMNSLKRKI